MASLPASSGRLSVAISLPLPRAAAYALVVREFEDALIRGGFRGEVKPEGSFLEGATPVASVVACARGEGARWDWRPCPWAPDLVLNVELSFLEEGDGTRLEFAVEGLDRLIDGGAPEVAGWVAGEVFADVAQALSPGRTGDWLTDRRARRPAGPMARRTYSDPTYHWPNFLLLLDRLHVTSADILLEVGCGGGALLARALESGCTAVGVDHSPDMVRLAREVNQSEVRRGRARILEGAADRLPVGTDEFTVAVLTGVFNFLPDPLAALREVHRALRPGGRLAVFATTEALRGTPAAPEPMASRLTFYDGDELATLATRAGFREVSVEMPDLEPFARAAGLSGPALDLFRGTDGAILLLARKTSRASSAG